MASDRVTLAARGRYDNRFLHTALTSRNPTNMRVPTSRVVITLVPVIPQFKAFGVRLSPLDAYLSPEGADQRPQGGLRSFGESTKGCTHARFAQIVPGSLGSIHARFQSTVSPPKLFGLFRTQSFRATGQDAPGAYNERFDDT
jgi:hypothetical protein